MCASGVHLIRASVADMRPYFDEGGAGCLRLCALNSLADRVRVVSVFQYLGMPAVGVEAFCNVFGEGDIGIALDRDMIVVVKEDQVSEAEVACQGGCFRADAFH